MKRLTTELFIERSIKTQGEKYIYNKTDLEHRDEKGRVCITCPKHGDFWQIPNDHMRGIGCEKCKYEKVSKLKRGTIASFIEKAKKKYGDKYDYSKVEYIDAKTPVCIICPIHGEFWIAPYKFLSGRECSRCKREERRVERNKKFLEMAMKVHHGKYDYSKVVYVDNKTLVCIICPIHGEFWQRPDMHLQGQNCPKCAGRNKTTEEWIEEARKIHGNKYDYSKVVYVDNITLVCIICPIHGEFWQRPSTHISQKCGCPICKQSHLESKTREFLLENKIEFTQQRMFNWLGLMRLDFYLPKYSMAIECQGIQHFEPIDFFGGERAYKDLIKRDKLKKDLCEQHNIKVVYINYDDNIDEKLNKQLL